MPRQRLKEPIESFGPDMLNTLVEGSKRDFTSPLVIRGDARRIERLYRRLLQFRRRLHDENHTTAPLVRSTHLRIVEIPGTNRSLGLGRMVELWLWRRDTEFSDLLSASLSTQLTPSSQPIPPPSANAPAAPPPDVPPPNTPPALPDPLADFEPEDNSNAS